MKLLSAFFLLMLLAATQPSLAQNTQFRVLLYTKTAGFHHESIHAGVAAIRALGERHHFTITWEESARVFTDAGLERYQAIIFLNTTGDILDADQQAAMEKFIRGGKGFVGIHAAADTEYDWVWYTQLVGRMFRTHPQIQTARLTLESKDFPGLELWPSTRIWTDEWYQYGEENSKNLKYLITVDEKTYDPKVTRPNQTFEGMGDFHPMSWYQEFDGGRAFYTGLGHIPAIYSDALFLEHLYGAIYWAATGKGMPAAKGGK